MNKTALLKQYQSRLQDLTAKREELKSELATRMEMMTLLNKDIKDVQAKISGLKSSEELVVSEHAILRYLERVEGLDISVIKEKILKDTKLATMTQTLGSGTYPHDGGFKVVTDGNIIVTIK